MCLQGNADSLLHIACRKKDYEMAKLFVESGATVDAQNVRNFYMFSLQPLFGFQTADVFSNSCWWFQDEGHTPLHVTAWEGDEAMVKYLHQIKANANVIDKVWRK